MFSYWNQPRSGKQRSLSGGRWPGSLPTCVAGDVFSWDRHLYYKKEKLSRFTLQGHRYIPCIFVRIFSWIHSQILITSRWPLTGFPVLHWPPYTVSPSVACAACEAIRPGACPHGLYAGFLFLQHCDSPRVVPWRLAVAILLCFPAVCRNRAVSCVERSVFLLNRDSLCCVNCLISQSLGRNVKEMSHVSFHP